MKMMTPREVAETFGMSYATVHRAIRLGRLRAKGQNGMYLIASDDAEKWRSSVRPYMRNAILVSEKPKSLILRMPETMLERVRELAAANKKSMSAYCRIAIEKQIEEEQKNG